MANVALLLISVHDVVTDTCPISAHRVELCPLLFSSLETPPNKTTSLAGCFHLFQQVAPCFISKIKPLFHFVLLLVYTTLHNLHSFQSHFLVFYLSSTYYSAKKSSKQKDSSSLFISFLLV